MSKPGDRIHPPTSGPAPGAPDPGLAGNAVSGEFGSNAWMVMDLLDQYRRDPQSVAPAWRAYFQGLDAAPGSASVPVTPAAPAVRTVA